MNTRHQRRSGTHGVKVHHGISNLSSLLQLSLAYYDTFLRSVLFQRKRGEANQAFKRFSIAGVMTENLRLRNVSRGFHWVFEIRHISKMDDGKSRAEEDIPYIPFLRLSFEGLGIYTEYLEDQRVG